MLKSKAYDDYFEVPFESLKPNEPLPFNVYLFFPRNRHILLWRSVQELVTITFMAKYVERGVKKVFLHKEDSELFRIYQAPTLSAENTTEPSVLPPTPGDVPEIVLPDAPQVPTATGQKLVEILHSQNLTPEQKVSDASFEARKMIQDIGCAATIPAQVAANAHARDIIRDVLEKVSKEAASVVGQVWQLADVNPDLEHSVNVATQAVIFAMAFGRIDETLIADIALAGLLHDIGMTQVPPHIASIPLKEQTTDDMRIYAKHIRATLDLIDLYTPNASARTRAIILQHHEKFNGSGFPQGLKGFHFDDIAQLIGIADVLDMISSGQWDGQKRTLVETFDTLEKIEKSRTFPEYFNPDVFEILTRWLRDPKSSASTESAIQVVVGQSKNILEAGIKDHTPRAA